MYLERNLWVEVYNISKVCAYCVTKYCVAWSAGHWWRGCWPCPRTSGSVTQDQGSGSVASSAPGLACNNTVVSRSEHYYEHYSLVLCSIEDHFVPVDALQ